VKASFCSVPFFLSFPASQSVSQSVSQYVVAVGVGVGVGVVVSVLVQLGYPSRGCVEGGMMYKS